MTTRAKYPNLHRELSAIASDELGTIIDRVAIDGIPSLSVEEMDRLARYLTSELSDEGMLSMPQLTSELEGQPSNPPEDRIVRARARTIRREAAWLLARLTLAGAQA